MGEDKRQHTWEERVRFVAHFYEEGRFDEEKAWQRFVAEHALRRFYLCRRWLFGSAAAVLLLLVGFGARWFLGQEPEEWIVEATGTGQVKQVYLPDSSLVTLAGNSELRYDRNGFGKDSRRVAMRGTAYFEVTRRETAPFSVSVRNTTTTVLGTSFQVEELPGQIAVDVLTGKVRFDVADCEVVLTAGMSAVYKPAAGTIERSDTVGVNRFAWKTGELHFRSTPMEQVIRDLENYYHREVSGLRSADRELRLTATFREQSLEDVLSVINHTLDIQLTVGKENR